MQQIVVLREVVGVVTWMVFLYFLALNLFYALFLLLSTLGMGRQFRRTYFAGYETISRSPLSLPISILVPAYNEELNIVTAIEALRQVRYPLCEIIVINDGSIDRTLEVLKERFHLRPMDRAIHQPVHPQTKKPLVTSQPIRGVYFSASKSNLKEIIVVDKENGGKADALNAGLTVSRYPLVCTIDADSVLDDDGLLKVVKPFLEKPDLMVAQGGIVRLANGCRLENGKIAGIGLPRKALPMFQVVEYVRAFVGSRLGQSELNSLLIISGVFALFKREAVLEVGGFDRSSIVEDMDLIVRLHRRQRELKRPYRIGYVPEPIAWTEGPETLRDLGKQRFRWQRGLLQTLWRHRDMFLNPRFGVIGLFAYPYYVVFEALGPVIEAIGYILIPSFFVLGMLNLQSFLVFFLLAFLAGSLLSVISLFLLEFSVRKYPRFGDAVRLVVFAFLESFGYRQLTLLWRLKALFAGPLSRSAWGHPRRTGFGTKAAPPSRG